MKNNILFLIVFVFLAKAELSIAQVAYVTKAKDTINYLIDLDKIPVNDRILKVDTSKNGREYILQCHCLAEGQNPYWLYLNKSGYKEISKDSLKAIKFISLSGLIEILQKAPRYTGGDKYVFFFYEPYRNVYKKRKAIYLEPRGIAY